MYKIVTASLLSYFPHPPSPQNDSLVIPYQELFTLCFGLVIRILCIGRSIWGDLLVWDVLEYLKVVLLVRLT